MKPQFAQVSGNASVPRSTVLLPMTCSSETRLSPPCHCSWPQNGQLMRAPRLLRKSKMRFASITPHKLERPRLEACDDLAQASDALVVAGERAPAADRVDACPGPKL